MILTDVVQSEGNRAKRDHVVGSEWPPLLAQHEDRKPDHVVQRSGTPQVVVSGQRAEDAVFIPLLLLHFEVLQLRFLLQNELQVEQLLDISQQHFVHFLAVHDVLHRYLIFIQLLLRRDLLQPSFIHCFLLLYYNY